VILVVLETNNRVATSVNAVELWKNLFWYKVRLLNTSHYEVEPWLEENLKGFYDVNGLTYRFSREEIAVMFRLRWE
jgi:hypothetical protein